MNKLSPETEAPDAALLIAFANGDAGAAQLLAERLLPRTLAQAQRMLGDRAEAEDVAQEAMMRLWRIAGEWRQGEAQVSTWLYRVTANLCTDRLRRWKRSVPLYAVAEPLDTAPSVTARMQSEARAKALSDALAQLPPRQAEEKRIIELN